MGGGISRAVESRTLKCIPDPKAVDGNNDTPASPEVTDNEEMIKHNRFFAC